MPTDAERMAALERRVADLEAMMAVLTAAPEAGPSTTEYPGDLLHLIRSKQKIQAIARYRELYGVGLAEAKNAVEKLELEV